MTGPTSRPIGVAVAQLAPVLGDVAGNVARAVAAVDDAAARGASVVVLPELATTGYAFTDAAELRPYAEPADGPSLTAVSAVAARTGTVVVGGFAELDDENRLRNSAFVVDPTGLRGVYRKVHLWDAETTLFVPGDDPPLVVDTTAGRVGVIVCYDIEFPEMTRAAALAGADLVCVPTNWPLEERRPGEDAAQIVIGRAAARTNRVFIAVADRVGPERGVEWAGGSGVVDPGGHLLAVPGPERVMEVVIGECALAEAREKRTSAHNDVFADRRPEVYSALVEPRGT